MRRSSYLLKQLRQRRDCRFLSANLTMKHLRILARLTFLQPMTSIRFLLLVRRGKQQPQQQKQEQTQLTVQSATEQHFVHVTFFFCFCEREPRYPQSETMCPAGTCRSSFAGETSRGGFSPSPSRWKLLIEDTRPSPSRPALADTVHRNGQSRRREEQPRFSQEVQRLAANWQ